MTPKFEARRILASLVTIGVLFMGGFSIAGCQNDTAPRSSSPQRAMEIGSNSPAPPSDQTPVSNFTSMPSPAQPPLTQPPQMPPVVLTPISPAPRPAPRKVTAPAAAPAPPPATSSAPRSGSCDADYYRNSDGNCVHRPQQASSVPAGATARCTDGTYSFSQHRQGTCSGHRGVAQWL